MLEFDLKSFTRPELPATWEVVEAVLAEIAMSSGPYIFIGADEPGMPDEL
jgi:hypothetical protein